MVTVPNVVTAAQHLSQNPVIIYTSDSFQKPSPFMPDVVVGIDATIGKKIDAIGCHVSQFFEWLPYNAGILHEVPAGEAERRTWLRQSMEDRFHGEAASFRAQLIERCGAERGRQIQFAEAFEVCEYGASLTPYMTRQLFPF
jgi:hypothetical protein